MLGLFSGWEGKSRLAQEGKGCRNGCQPSAGVSPRHPCIKTGQSVVTPALEGRRQDVPRLPGESASMHMALVPPGSRSSGTSSTLLMDTHPWLSDGSQLLQSCAGDFPTSRTLCPVPL